MLTIDSLDFRTSYHRRSGILLSRKVNDCFWTVVDSSQFSLNTCHDTELDVLLVDMRHLTQILIYLWAEVVGARD